MNGSKSKKSIGLAVPGMPVGSVESYLRVPKLNQQLELAEQN